MTRRDDLVLVNVPRWLTATMAMSATESGCYFLLLAFAALHGPLPNKDENLCAITRTRPEVWADIWPHLESLFVDTANGLYPRDNNLIIKG